MNGYIEGNGYQVTWTFGHLCTLKEPHEYTDDWKRWSLGALPMIPPRFGIKLISNPTYEQQFKVIESLMQNAEMVINCQYFGNFSCHTRFFSNTYFHLQSNPFVKITQMYAFLLRFP